MNVTVVFVWVVSTKQKLTLDLTSAAPLVRDNMLKRGTFISHIYISNLKFNISSSFTKTIKVSVANKMELINKNASEVVCMHILAMAQLLSYPENVRI